jgi:hypothetical protein
MSSLREHIATYAKTSANLLTQLNELHELRERVRKAQLSSRDTPATEKAHERHRRVLAPSANWRSLISS